MVITQVYEKDGGRGVYSMRWVVYECMRRMYVGECIQDGLYPNRSVPKPWRMSLT